MSELQSVADDTSRSLRLAEFAAQDRENREAEKAGKRENRDFVQVYEKGWLRLQSLIAENPGAARVYAFLAQHIDGTAGTVVVSQDVLASELKVHVITIKRHTKFLEQVGALVRIRVGGGVYGYALDPKEVWKSWDSAKELAAFVTRTLVLKSDKANNQVNRKLKVMVGE
jgi:DNA-binding transcriptional regulator YhcF (GntR family)